ncbi:MAG TPA: RluA family pseudouridine synthase [Thermoanaerobaculia bacterium]|nr:RluA family pseudouridine synthase [Thermoanaerobaculia bacterium]
MTDPSGLTLLDVLQQRFPESSKTSLRTMLQSDRVRVNGVPERNAKRQVRESDQIEISARSFRPLDPRVRIVFEDSDLVVVDKAAGLLTVPSPQVQYETAESFLNAHYGGRPDEPRIHHVHRLDRDTSGVLVFARNTFARDRLQALFASHDIERTYVAIVHGKLRESSGVFRSFLAEDHDLRVRSVAGPSEGKEAITHYRVTASGRRFSILELTLETGRRNQIRVHLSEAGHPVVGDTMYGKGRESDLGRLALHARDLGLVHPRSGMKLRFTAEVPRAFRELDL